ncbi:MAG: AraC family transcriptional regulator [bacterium]|nr:AraC family transcriptional regulator [bacterium]
MNDISYSTVGREIYPGQIVNIGCMKDIDFLEERCNCQRFRIVYLKEGHGILHNGDKSQIITSPSVLCLNLEDRVSLENAADIKMDALYFDPFCYGRYVEYQDYDDWKEKLHDDAYFFRAFFERNEHYIGACSINYSLGKRLSQLITQTETELQQQRDEFWPCRSRSYFIELLLNANSIYNEDKSEEQIFDGKTSTDVAAVVDWIHIHYLDKVVLEDITREFHTNKTTLNQKFKAEMGITVMEYIISLRMQMACSLLRKTFLSVGEIMDRSGYRDDAHFLRSFKKFAGCTPTEYRTQYE